VPGRIKAGWLKWALLAFILLVRAVDINERHELHPDEVYSVLLSGCNPAYTRPVPDGSYTGAELQAGLIGVHSLGHDLKQLYINNADAPHASLYYMLLRLCLCGFNSWDAGRAALIGGLLNLALLACCYLLLWGLAMRVCGHDPWLCAGTAAMAFLSPGAGECVALVREYQLAMLGIIWYTVAVLRLHEGIRGVRRDSRFVAAANVALSCALCLSSGYLNSLYVICLPLFIVILTVRVTGPRPAARFTLAVGGLATAGLAVAACMYRGYFFFLTHRTVHTSKAFNDFPGSLQASLWRDTVLEGLTLPALVCLGAAVVITVAVTTIRPLRTRLARLWTNCSHRPAGIAPQALACVLAALAAIVLVQYASLLRQSRYSYPFLPLLSLALPLATMSLKKIWAHAIAIFMAAYFCMAGAKQAPCRDFGWERQRRVMRNGALLYNLNANEQVLLYPILNPDAIYTVRHNPGHGPDFTAAPVTMVNYCPEGLPAGTVVTRFQGPVRSVELRAERCGDARQTLSALGFQPSALASTAGAISL